MFLNYWKGGKGVDFFVLLSEKVPLKKVFTFVKEGYLFRVALPKIHFLQ